MKALISTSVILSVLFFNSAMGQQQSLAASWGLFVYPSEGQTADQQGLDEFECYTWGKQTTGIDPLAPPGQQQAAQVQQQDPAGTAAAGALRGAATAYLIADVTDHDTSDAAAVGAVMGARRGRASAKARNQQAQQSAQQQQQQAAQEQTQMFKNAFSACMEGRKYTVK